MSDDKRCEEEGCKDYDHPVDTRRRGAMPENQIRRLALEVVAEAMAPEHDIYDIWESSLRPLAEALLDQEFPPAVTDARPRLKDALKKAGVENL